MLILLILGYLLHRVGLTWEESFWAMCLQALVWTLYDTRRRR